MNFYNFTTINFIYLTLLFVNMKKILFLPLLFVAIMVTNSLSAQSTTKKNILPGAWFGRISADGTDLRIVFHLKLIEKDSLIATLDSPDQGAKDIPVGQVILDMKKLVIQAPDLNGEYNGTITGDSTMEGTWSQNGADFPLNLKKLSTSLTTNIPK
jgi:uncharacterized protein